MSLACAAVKKAAVLIALAGASVFAQAAEEQLVNFSTQDGWNIAGLYRAPKLRKPVAVLVHGVGSSKSEWRRLAPELWKIGWGTLAMDLRGHGESTQGPQGAADFRSFDVTGEWLRARYDIRAALSFLGRRAIAVSRIGLIGASIGANLASQAATKEPWIVLLSPGSSYHGVTIADLEGHKVLAAASPADSYAYSASTQLCDRIRCTFLQARSGHGAQMLEDPDFLRRLLNWLKKKAKK